MITMFGLAARAVSAGKGPTTARTMARRAITVRVVIDILGSGDGSRAVWSHTGFLSTGDHRGIVARALVLPDDLPASMMPVFQGSWNMPGGDDPGREPTREEIDRTEGP